jgi:hypothetical protein
MATLLPWLHYSGARDVTGAPVSSGLAYFYQVGSTSVAVTAYADADETTPLTQPVALNAAGQAEVYLADQAEVIVKTAAGATVKLSTNANGIHPDLVTVDVDGVPTLLQALLDDIRDLIPISGATVRGSASATPSFEFNPAYKTNVFGMSYPGAVTSITITWPNPAPTLKDGDTYRIVLQFPSGTTFAGTVNFPAEIVEGDDVLTTCTADEMVSADFVVTMRTGALAQCTPWEKTGGAIWT